LTTARKSRAAEPSNRRITIAAPCQHLVVPRCLATITAKPLPQVSNYKELEHFRFRISSELDRLTKLRHQEFEALPQLWALTNKAYGAASVIASGFNLHSDLNQIFDDDFFGIVDSSLLPDWQKKRELSP
ncbi:MAG TPA: hypothetical protein VIM52_04480, partial [Stellaceae bacterium]